MNWEWTQANNNFLFADKRRNASWFSCSTALTVDWQMLIWNSSTSFSAHLKPTILRCCVGFSSTRCLGSWMVSSFTYFKTTSRPWLSSNPLHIRLTYTKQNFFSLFARSLSLSGLPATFQIIKKLLNKRTVEVLKFVDAKSVRKYIDEDNIPVAWGGQNSYEYEFVPEVRAVDKENVMQPSGDSNNNVSESSSLTSSNSVGIIAKKVSEMGMWIVDPLSPVMRLLHVSSCTPHYMLYLACTLRWDFMYVVFIYVV